MCNEFICFLFREYFNCLFHMWKKLCSGYTVKVLFPQNNPPHFPPKNSSSFSPKNSSHFSGKSPQFILKKSPHFSLKIPLISPQKLLLIFPKKIPPHFPSKNPLSFPFKKSLHFPLKIPHSHHHKISQSKCQILLLPWQSGHMTSNYLYFNILHPPLSQELPIIPI